MAQTQANSSVQLLIIGGASKMNTINFIFVVSMVLLSIIIYPQVVNGQVPYGTKDKIDNVTSREEYKKLPPEERNTIISNYFGCITQSGGWLIDCEEWVEEQILRETNDTATEEIRVVCEEKWRERDVEVYLKEPLIEGCIDATLKELNK